MTGQISAIDRTWRGGAWYPLQYRLAAGGVLGGAAVGLWSGSGLLAWCVLVLAITTGLLWRRREPPVLAFCFGYQWIFAVSGLVFVSAQGMFPGLAVAGDIDRAVMCSMAGFLVLALGIRAVSSLLPWRDGIDSLGGRDWIGGCDTRRLFWLVVLAYSASWLVEITPILLTFNAAQVLGNIFALRGVLLCALWLAITRQGRGYGRGFAALLFVLTPQLASVMSDFKEVLFALLVIALGEWRPWERRGSDSRRARFGLAAFALAVGLLGMGMLWESGIKPVWRPAVVGRTVEGTPAEKAAAFLSTAGRAVTGFSLAEGVVALGTRVSSGLGYFSLVVDRVPRIIPHENGALVGRAIWHVMTPRFLFPEKESLGADSWLVRRYAGVRAAGESEGTSIGLGYIAQFYIDFGVPGMFVGLFAYGMFLGSLCACLRWLCRSSTWYAAAVVVIFLQHFSTYEGEIAKQAGGLLQMVLVVGCVMRLIGEPLERYLARPANKRLAEDHAALGGA